MRRLKAEWRQDRTGARIDQKFLTVLWFPDVVLLIGTAGARVRRTLEDVQICGGAVG